MVSNTVYIVNYGSLLIKKDKISLSISFLPVLSNATCSGMQRRSLNSVQENLRFSSEEFQFPGETGRMHRLKFVYINILRISAFWKIQGSHLLTSMAVNNLSCVLSVLQRIQQPFKSSDGTSDRFFRLPSLVICSGGSQPGDIGGLHFFQLF